MLYFILKQEKIYLIKSVFDSIATKEIEGGVTSITSFLQQL